LQELIIAEKAELKVEVRFAHTKKADIFSELFQITQVKQGLSSIAIRVCITEELFSQENYI